jgi:HK97 family phage prohead protease
MSLETQFPTRLITLPDGSSGLRGSLHVEIQQPASADQHPELTLDFISSDETLDRYNEIISAGGWQLANYQRNPVFQNAHQYGDILFTLGRALITELRPVADRQVLYQRIQFATEANPFARIAYNLYKGKFLTAVSVGFVPLRWEDGNQKTPYRRKYLEQELLEVSAVAIPANPNALTLAYKSGALEKSDLRETADLLSHLLSDPPTERLLTLARNLRDLLRHT